MTLGMFWLFKDWSQGTEAGGARHRVQMETTLKGTQA